MSGFESTNLDVDAKNLRIEEIDHQYDGAGWVSSDWLEENREQIGAIAVRRELVERERFQHQKQMGEKIRETILYCQSHNNDLGSQKATKAMNSTYDFQTLNEPNLSSKHSFLLYSKAINRSDLESMISKLSTFTSNREITQGQIDELEQIEANQQVQTITLESEKSALQQTLNQIYERLDQIDVQKKETALNGNE